MPKTEISPIRLKSCPKGYTRDLDKAIDPQETFQRVSGILAASGRDIFAGTMRADAGRLGIPVYLSRCGAAAREIMPVRKQMGKGASEAQAKASALMELVERYSFFSFFARRPGFVRTRWEEAQGLFGSELMDVEEICLSVGDPAEPALAAKILSLREWDFYPATRLHDGKTVWLPLDWFRMLGEFNGSSAGNTAEESILQAIAELVERHVCALADSARSELATIDPCGNGDSTLQGLLAAFASQGIMLLLKDISFGMPMPSVAALAFDPATFPDKSEIVFTAGTATSPGKAAIRAITEAAQLGGDFCTSSCYEASGLGKFGHPDEFAWLLRGSTVSLSSLPDISHPDIREEIHAVASALLPLHVYAAETTNPGLGIPAHYCIIPGLAFRERDRNQSLGLFTGRKLAEAGDGQALKRLETLCPGAHYLQFFEGLVALGEGKKQDAARLFADSAPLQPDADARALALFYEGYAQTLAENWKDALAPLQEACGLCPGMKEYANLLGVALFREKNYQEAEKYFEQALRLDKGSATDLANRGVCRKLQGKTQAAREDLLAALELAPDLEFARRHLADIAES